MAPKSQKLKPQSSYLTFRNAAKEFFRRTTAHGLHSAGYNKRLLMKIVWGVLFLVGLVLFSYFAHDVVVKYSQHPVTTTNSETDGEIEFPAIVICNINPIPETKLPSDISLEDVMSHFMSSDDAGKLSQGYIYSDMILRCAYDGDNCMDYGKHFYYHFDEKFGNCFVFNGRGPRRKKGALKSATEPGPQHGLHLILKVDDSEYLALGHEAVGSQIGIYSSNEMPVPALDGFVVSPGTETHVALTVEKKERIKPPYSDCKEDDTNSYGYKYTRQACKQTCLQELIKADCGCFHPHLIKPESADPLCDLTIERVRGCTEDLQNQPKRNCDCPIQCSEITFKKEMSTTSWPVEEAEPKILKDIGINGSSQIDTVQDLKKKFLSIYIYMKRIRTSTSEETSAYTVSALLADIGGISALFWGVSILTLVEFAEFLGTFVTIPCKDYKPHKDDQQVAASERDKRRSRRDGGQSVSETPFQQPSSSGDKKFNEGADESGDIGAAEEARVEKIMQEIEEQEANQHI